MGQRRVFHCTGYAGGCHRKAQKNVGQESLQALEFSICSIQPSRRLTSFYTTKMHLAERLSLEPGSAILLCSDLVLCLHDSISLGLSMLILPVNIPKQVDSLPSECSGSCTPHPDLSQSTVTGVSLVPIQRCI